ncbi:hypothetical protein MLD38_010442 [Melastoma candidum]|uniref:Uncharacterized protein n=1 Tax=Melastoma candidum TaxID=119954 RepID=A0ACB9R0X4_9MYRT|nr:hypothetical protein MLD38_010442 [Melastoma candidum]
MQSAAIFFPRIAIPRPSLFTRSAIKMSTKTPLPSPVLPKFVPFDGGDVHSRSKPDGFRFSLVSYNILAQAYVKSALFPHSPSSCLKWKARSQAILTVLKGLDVDFLCLQELDEYEEFYRSNMALNGYSSIYVKRSGQKRDGCGIFYKQDRANLVLEEKIDYNDLVSSVQDDSDFSTGKDSQQKLSKDQDAGTRPGLVVNEASNDRKESNDPQVRLKRDCVGIMTAFRLNNKSQAVIIVANTHLYWDPDWADVKLAQAKHLLSLLAEFRTMVSEKFECTPSVIVAGDFNSTPGDKVYNYLVSGDTSAMASQCLEGLPLPLRSVYACTRGEPMFTNCTPGFTGTLDYIFFCPSFYIKPVGFLELPEGDSEDVIGGLPNHYHPSDHLPIGAEFEVSDNSQV